MCIFQVVYTPVDIFCPSDQKQDIPTLQDKIRRRILMDSVSPFNGDDRDPGLGPQVKLFQGAAGDSGPFLYQIGLCLYPLQEFISLGEGLSGKRCSPQDAVAIASD